MKGGKTKQSSGASVSSSSQKKCSLFLLQETSSIGYEETFQQKKLNVTIMDK